MHDCSTSEKYFVRPLGEIIFDLTPTNTLYAVFLFLTGADVNRLHGTLLPLHCACMVSDSYIVRLLLRKGAKVGATGSIEG